MCSTCGCGEADVRVTTWVSRPDGATHTHEHPHGHDHQHHHGTSTSRARHVHLEPDRELRTHTLDLEVAVLAKNDHLAAHNRPGSPSGASSR